METSTMGRVLVAVTVENLNDRYNAEKGNLPREQVRRVDIPDALVDTGASTLSMPRRLIDQLGLVLVRTRRARTSAGPVTTQVFGTAYLVIQGRDCACDVVEVPDDCPVLIGQIPLELVDFVIDPVGQRLIGNPAHGGEHIIELY